MIFGIVFGGLFGLLVVLFLVYLLLLVRPCAKQPNDARLLCDYAHRGLHGKDIPENSLAAFEAACRAHMGIELDRCSTWDLHCGPWTL